MDFDAEAVGPPPRLEALLRGPQFPEFRDLGPVRALDDNLWSGRVARGRGLTLVVHVSCSLFGGFLRDCWSSSAAPRRSRRASHKLRYWASHSSSPRKGSGLRQ